jgi:hypothetical protein
MAGESLTARFSLLSQLWFRWTEKCLETATSHMQTVTSKPKKQTNDRTKREFLLHKEKEENGKPSPQKQEFSCSSPSAVTSQPHTCFFTPTFELKITSIKSHFKPYFFRFTQFSE